MHTWHGHISPKSLLSVVDEVLERIAVEAIYHHLEENALLSDHKLRLRSCLSTSDVLMLLSLGTGMIPWEPAWTLLSSLLTSPVPLTGYGMRACWKNSMPKASKDTFWCWWITTFKGGPTCHGQWITIKRPPSRGLSSSGICTGIGLLVPVHRRPPQEPASSFCQCWWLYALPLLPRQPACSYWYPPTTTLHARVGDALIGELYPRKNPGDDSLLVPGSLKSCCWKGDVWYRHFSIPRLC